MKLATVLRYVNDLDDWARADEMRGSLHPDIRDEVHEKYERVKKRLKRAIRGLDQ